MNPIAHPVNDANGVGCSDPAHERLRDGALGQAVNEFKERGYLILHDLLPPDLLEALRSQYTHLLEAKVRRFGLKKVEYYDQRGQFNDGVLNDFKPEGGNHDLNRWNMHLPSRLPFFDERVIANPAVVAILEQVFETDWVCYLVASDTPYPGSGYQSLHQDFSRLSVALNLPLVDFREDNGPVEVWPGTHRADPGGPAAAYSNAPYFISPSRMEEIKRTVRSERLLLKAGSVLIRDHRLVHRGTANLSEQPRPMLSIYYAPVHPLPYRWLADCGAGVALALRRLGRGRGGAIQFRSVFDLGNVLGRIVEEGRLSDRDYRRRIPAGLWGQLSTRAQSLLRYASLGPGARCINDGGSLHGSYLLLRSWVRNLGDSLSSSWLARPRKPDQEQTHHSET